MVMHYGFGNVFILCKKHGTHIDYITSEKEKVTCPTCLKMMRKSGMIRK